MPQYYDDPASEDRDFDDEFDGNEYYYKYDDEWNEDDDDDPNHYEYYDGYIEVASDLTIRELLTTNRYPLSERLSALWSKLRWLGQRKIWWIYNPLRKLYYRMTGKFDPGNEIPF